MPRIFTVLLTAVLLSISAAAQTATGILQGRVVDATGAAVPDAKVAIENETTGVALTLLTNSEGNFFRSFLLPGNYRVTVEKAGFQQKVTSGVRVDVQQTVALDVVLQVGDVKNTVEVQASAVQLATATSSVSTVIGSKMILELPLNGRNPFSLAILTPGVIPTSGTSLPWISGGRNASSEITIDGTSVILPENNVSVNTLAYTPVEDSVEEFSVITNALAAEYGRTGGGVINVATRGGTNSLHGSAYDYLRNSKLDSNTWSNNRNGVKLGAFQRNQFGGTAGGPIVVPGLYDGRNRTFFFFSEQSTRTRSASSATASVPVADWLNGDFSALKNGSGQLITIYDPASVSQNGSQFVRTPFPGNVIPRDRMDPVALKVMSYFPAPNAVPNNAFTFQNNYFLSGKAASGEDKFDSRIDQNFSSKFRVFARGSYGYSYSNPFNGFQTIGTSSGSGPSSTASYNVTANGIYTFNATTILNVNYGFGRFVNLSDAFSQGTDPASLGFPKAVSAVAATTNFEFPRFDFSGNTNLSSLGQATFTTLRFRPSSDILRADLTKVFSAHTVKFGGEFRKLFMNFTQLGQPDGQYSFSDANTRQIVGGAASTTQGNGFASYLLGLPASGTIQHTFAIAEASAYWGLYVQDDYRVSRKLTLNIGVRWEVDIPRTERYNRLSYWDANAASPIAGKVPVFPNLKGAMTFVTPDHRHQVPTDLNNVGPRFGFAYRINDKTVFRGAYGLMYAGSVLQAAGTSGSSGTEGFQSSTNETISNDGGRTFASSLSNPFPAGFNFPLGAAPSAVSGPSTNLGLGVGESIFNDWQNPIIQQWNGTLQRQVKGGILLEAGYLGSKGQHLIDGESSMAMNQLPASYFSLGNQLLGTNQVSNPFFGIITNPTSSLAQPTVSYAQLLKPFPQYTSVSPFRKPQANSLYHSFTLRAEKRFSHGLNLLLSYTGGKLIDDASQVVTFLGAAGTKQDYYNRKAERSVSAQDVSRQLVISFNYDLPAGKGRMFLTHMPAPLEWLIGGWQGNGIYTYRTGIPLQISNGVNQTNLGSPGQRPNNNGNSAKLSGPVESRLNEYFDTSVFSQAGIFTFGNTSRTSPDLRAPALHNIDFSIFKNFALRERATLRYQAEFYNGTNTPLWSAPGTTVNAVSGFGVITSASSQRVCQMALKLMF
jgi:hypothetical protein